VTFKAACDRSAARQGMRASLSSGSRLRGKGVRAPILVRAPELRFASSPTAKRPCRPQRPSDSRRKPDGCATQRRRTTQAGEPQKQHGGYEVVKPNEPYARSMVDKHRRDKGAPMETLG
jgi:hypothetical protein